MPLRQTVYRTLRPDFRQHLTRFGVWPPLKTYVPHMKQLHSGVQRKALGDAKRGAAVPEKCIRGIVECLRARNAIPGSEAALLEYVASRKVEFSLGGPTINQLIELVTGDARSTPGPPEEATDFLRLGVRGVVSLFPSPGRWIGAQSRPSSLAEIDTLFEWLAVHIAYEQSNMPSRETLTFEDAKPFAEHHMGISISEYAARARKWREAVPATVRVALGRRHPVGFTVVLPLRKHAYEEVRSGKKESYECNVDDLVVPSRDLFIQIVAQRAGACRVEPDNPTQPLLASLLTQLAHLSSLGTASKAEQLRMVSFAGVPSAKVRLRKQHFKETGHKTPRSSREVMERTVSVGARVAIDSLTVMLLRQIEFLVPIE